MENCTRRPRRPQPSLSCFLFPVLLSPVSNFSATDAGVIAGATGVSAPIGYLAGLRTRTARPALWAAAAIGGAAGFCLAYQRSAGRLMGFLTNDKEVEKGLRPRS